MIKKSALLSSRLTLAFLLFSSVVFIFLNSLTSAAASAENSGIAFSFLSRLFGFLPFFTHALLRKVAHFAEYALLGFLSLFFPRVFLKGKRREYFALLPFGLLIASADEILQFFSPGRVPLFTDVLIDLGGFLFGLLCALPFQYFWCKRSAL